MTSSKGADETALESALEKSSDSRFRIIRPMVLLREIAGDDDLIVNL